MSDQIPPGVESFVSDFIGSIAELELLLLLADDPSRTWEISAVAKQLYVTEPAAEAVLVRMTSRGLFSHAADGYRFTPRSPELGATVKALADLYSIRRLKVVEMIYAGPSEKYQSFADAFRFRKHK